MINKLKERMERLRDATESAASKLLVSKVSEDIQQSRYDICQGCEKLYKLTDTCKVCGCFMKVKTWMPEQECPLGKWHKISVIVPDSQGTP